MGWLKKLIACLFHFHYNGRSFRRKGDSIETKNTKPEHATAVIFSLPVRSCLCTSANNGPLPQFFIAGFLQLEFSMDNREIWKSRTVGILWDAVEMSAGLRPTNSVSVQPSSARLWAGSITEWTEGEHAGWSQAPCAGTAYRGAIYIKPKNVTNVISSSMSNRRKGKTFYSRKPFLRWSRKKTDHSVPILQIGNLLFTK